jgi:outer membrane protein assembly factor BamB
MSPLFRSLCALCLAVLGPALAQGQDYAPASRVLVIGESVQIRQRLFAVEQLQTPAVSSLAAARSIAQLGLRMSPLEAPFALVPAVSDKTADLWAQLEEAYYDLLNDHGEALVALPVELHGLATARTSLQVRRLCHLRLAALPASVRANYRQRVETESKRLLVLGWKHRDSAPLRQLVDEMFGSAASAEALDLLGDLAFERGEFDEARAWWRRLAPLPPADGLPLERSPLRLAGPLRVDRVRVEAKQILALGFQGLLTQAQEELNRFHERHPRARGTLAGSDGPYSETLQAALGQVIKAGLANNADPWLTFGGAADRNNIRTVCPPATLWEDGPRWRVNLPPLDRPRTASKEKVLDPADRNAPLRRTALHPVIVGTQVLVADADSVTSFHLETGKRLFRYDLKSAGLGTTSGAERKDPSPRFTLTVEGKRAYARLGRQRLAPRRGGETEESSYLVCLDLAEPARPDRQREKWHVRAGADEFFEGAPVVRAGRAYIAVSRLSGKRVTTAIHCYDPLGRLRWSRDVCEIPEFDDGAAPRYRQNLLTWAGNQLVYCTHTGAVLAVDPWTGQTLWVVRYPSHGPLTPEGAPTPRDLAPCVYEDGRVFIAPLDSDRLFCLEACSGRVLWERDGLEIVHVLGATHGRLLLTVRHGLQALDAGSGLTLWQQPSEGRLVGQGRGLIAGSWLLWPTHDPKLPLRALTIAEGRQQKGDEENPFTEPAVFDPTQLRLIPAGNLAFGNGCLVVAGADELVAFVPADRQPPQPAGPEGRPHALHAPRPFTGAE